MKRANRKVRDKAAAPAARAGNRAQSLATAIVVRPPAPKPWLLTQDEVSILKNAVCKGATDEEMKYCLTVARRYELDPFQKQIWFVRRWDSEAIQSNGKKGSYVWTPQVSIDGLQNQAATHHHDYGSFSEPEYGPMIEISYQKSGQGASIKLKVPEWARVEAWKKGDVRPTVGKVWWEEIYRNVDYAPMVRQMPRLMLGKCAKAQAIRAAYPKKTGGLYIAEESMGSQEEINITPGGRLILEAEKPDPKYWCEKHKCDISKCPADEHTNAENEVLEALEQERKYTPEQREVMAKKVSPPSAPEKKGAAETPTGVAAAVPEILYAWVNETARIEPASTLTIDVKRLLTKFWKADEKVCVLNGEEFEALKYELTKRGIALKRKV